MLRKGLQYGLKGHCLDIIAFIDYTLVDIPLFYKIDFLLI